MASSIDPPRPPHAPVARVRAEAALQQQNWLLAAPGTALADASGLAHPAGASPQPPGAAAAAPGERLTLSAQAQVATALSTSALATASAGTARAASGVIGPHALASAPVPMPAQAPGPAASDGGGAPARAGGVAVQWPAQGVDAPLLRLFNALVQQVAASTGPAPRVLVAQPWPPGTGLPGDTGDAGDAGGAQGAGGTASPAMPALQIWRVAQGSLHTPDGVRGFTLTLRLPSGSAAFGAPAAAVAPAMPAAPPVPGAPAGLTAGFAGPMQALAPGVFALVLQSPGAAGQRTSALLSLELAPLPGSAAAAVVYGREPLQVRADPWLAMAALHASGQWRAEEEDDAHRRGDSLCRTPGCPYQGRAACVQPFCLALRVQPAPPGAPAAAA